MSELESNVGEDRHGVTSAHTTVTSLTQATDSKENLRRQLTKLSALPPLKNHPATRLPFKPVLILLNHFSLVKFGSRTFHR